ncbi:acyl carrier protein [Cohnella xylanilytica]|uniref:Acyl carrier protein n=1 Tax=Cohnella xylanilytica TaxID=557555 RepID=A0A841TYN7_9BACL|nr:acyl carrier protein [Cohnella xylanilytica]MBB6692212.1 acyl carrier protein [Cohnella xylanilytica]
MNKSTAIKEIMAELLNCDVENAETIARDSCSEWDSFKHLELMLTIEEHFKIKFDIEQINKAIDFYSILELVQGVENEA